MSVADDEDWTALILVSQNDHLHVTKLLDCKAEIRKN